MDFNNSQDNGQNNVQQEQAQYNYNAYGNNPYGNAPIYPQMPQANPNNGMAIASLVCGIISILLGCCCMGCYGVGVVLGIISVVFAVLSKKQNGNKLSGVATGGLVCGILGIVFGLIGVILFLVFGGIEMLVEMLAEMGY